jgi:hypothetical protein
MQDNESILLTAEGENGKIELTETSVRFTEYKKGPLEWNPQNCKVHEIPRDAIISAEVVLQKELYIFLPGDSLGAENYKHFVISFNENQLTEFENIVEEIGLQGFWYEDNKKLSNVLTYDSEEQASIDANKAIKRGWMPQSTFAIDNHINVGRTVAKTTLTGGVGLAVLGASRTTGKVSIIYVRTPEWLKSHKKSIKDLDSGGASRAAFTAFMNTNTLPPAASNPNDVIVQLERLAKLKEQGILTEEELQARKKKILGS